MQKILSILLIFIMAALPMLSVSASMTCCQHTPSQPSTFATDNQQDLQAISVVEMEMSDMLDCCATSNVSGDHNNACDCNDGQAGNSLVTSTQSTFVDHSTPFNKQVILDLFVSKSSESLYRPPILRLTNA
jgi:hypothetical protein